MQKDLEIRATTSIIETNSKLICVVLEYCLHLRLEKKGLQILKLLLTWRKKISKSAPQSCIDLKSRNMIAHSNKNLCLRRQLKLFVLSVTRIYVGHSSNRGCTFRVHVLAKKFF